MCLGYGGPFEGLANPAGERAEFEHDSVGNEIQVRHFDGRIETSEFDLAGRKTRFRRANGTLVTFEYDQANNLLRIQSGGIDLIVSEYDIEGRVLTTRTPETEVSFEYATPAPGFCPRPRMARGFSTATTA